MHPETFFQIIVIVYSVILHEIAHGYAALMFGDKTAYYKDRLTLNPIPHIDLMGSIIVPSLLILSGSSLLAGWAKPVPVSEHNLNPYKLGSFVVSIAGVLVNFALCIIFTIIGAYSDAETVKGLCGLVAVTNLGLGIFNLIPVPPADGYRIISVFLPIQLKRNIENFLSQNFFISIVVAILIATQIFSLIFPIFYRIIVSVISN
jgi:Zn-dependent protease